MMSHIYEKEMHSKSWAKDFVEMKDRFDKLTIIGKGTYGYSFNSIRSVYKASPLSDKTKIYALKKLQLFKEKDGVG